MGKLPSRFAATDVKLVERRDVVPRQILESFAAALDRPGDFFFEVCLAVMIVDRF